LTTDESPDYKRGSVRLVVARLDSIVKKTSLLCATLLGVAVTPSNSADLYWDVNDVVAGAGVPATGLWDGSTPNWNADPTGGNAAGPLVPWTIPENVAVFSAGTDAVGGFAVTISGTQTVGGILIQEGNVTFESGTAAVGTNTVTINTGASLKIDSSLRLSAALGAKMVLNGGTVVQTNPTSAGSFIPSNFELQIGANGGTVNYTSSGSGTVALYSGTITGTGTLTKTGPNEFRYQGLGLPNTTYTKLVVQEGLFRLGFNSSISDERGFGAVPAAFTPDAITLLNGGAIGLSFNVALNANRGITLGPGGGVINGTAGVLTVPGAITGAAGLTVLNNAVLSGANTYTGGTILNGGSLTTGTAASGGAVTANGATPFGGPTNPLSVNNVRTASGQTYTVNLPTTNPTTVGTLSGTIATPSEGTNTLRINNGGQLFTVNQASAGNFQGVIAGTGGFTLGALSTAALTFSGANLYTGGTTVAGGSLIADTALATIGAGDVSVLATAVKLSIQSGVLDAISNTAILSLAGGGVAGTADFGFLELSAGINETVGGLVLGGVTQANGTYGSMASAAQFKSNEYFVGTGILTVVPEPGTLASVLGGMALLLCRSRMRRRS
jgi:autotransporter-associated beta strand protein